MRSFAKLVFTSFGMVMLLAMPAHADSSPSPAPSPTASPTSDQMIIDDGGLRPSPSRTPYEFVSPAAAPKHASKPVSKATPATKVAVKPSVKPVVKQAVPSPSPTLAPALKPVSSNSKQDKSVYLASVLLLAAMGGYAIFFFTKKQRQ